MSKSMSHQLHRPSIVNWPTWP